MGNLFFNLNKQISNSYQKEQFLKETYQISADDLNMVLNTCGYNSIDTELGNLITKHLNSELSNLNEVAMLLAHMIHETGGFVYKEEHFAIENPNEAQKRYFDEKGLKNKSYHGRGFIMLSYPTNYLNASMGLNMKNMLLEHPELVAESHELCIKTALWYWNNVVKKSRNVCDSNFNASTLEINGPIESTSKGRENAKHRLVLYHKIAHQLKVKNISKK